MSCWDARSNSVLEVGEKCAESVLAGSEKCAERNVRKRAIRVNEECLREAHPLKIRVAQRGEKV